MTVLKENGTDKERLENITAVILWCENQGMSQRQVIEWIKENKPDHEIHVKLYYAYQNAGRGNPLQIPIKNIDYSLLENAKW